MATKGVNGDEADGLDRFVDRIVCVCGGGGLSYGGALCEVGPSNVMYDTVTQGRV